MEATLNSDAPSQQDDVVARLRVDEYDRLAAAKGVTTVVAAAELHSLNRSLLFDYRSGRKSPHLSTAMKMAADLGVTVEALFELRPGGDDRG
jgi:transcriptional regulator with XRE-family HTH domain